MTTNNLWKRGFVIEDWCSLCRSDGESVSHFLLHCSLVSNLWASIFCLVGIDWIMPNSVAAFAGILGWSKGSSKICKSSKGSSSLSYVVYSEGTKLSMFEVKEQSLPNLKFLFLKTLFKWVSVFNRSTYSLVEFLDSICLCCWYKGSNLFILFFLSAFFTSSITYPKKKRAAKTVIN